MLLEHDQSRGFISKLENANERYAAGNKNAIAEIVENARVYAALLRQHIRKEDMVLYPMAENALGDAVIEQMQPEFDRVEQEKKGVETKYLEILKQMETS
jgi:hemerythrin-like domain-containing protein